MIGIEGDSSQPADQAFGIDNGKFVCRDLYSEGDMNDQKGVIQKYSRIGAGVRNTKIYFLGKDLNHHKDVQYLPSCVKPALSASAGAKTPQNWISSGAIARQPDAGAVNGRSC
ncbi:hypothetical protein KYT87_26205 [Achromobacter sp. ES-001]|uniref:hypothetical protein n=1 Tax=Achromobacter sp. ES-001 TaxID=2860286 RepID=UPI001C63BCC1|nr:hypothetical protein [Achromobacter sp. ES-001]QYJ21058.1 hypothetical protein KYT87_26205 [Achromobacter sp. ES-001]